MRSILFIIFGLILTVQNCSEAPKEKSAENYQLGQAALDVTGKEDAQEKFKEGLLLLHSFEYEDAREAFLAAQASDVHMAMAYWGEAMTYNHSLWGEQEYEKGIAAIEKMEQAAKQVEVTALEQDFMQAINILYQKGVAKSERDQAYANFMKELNQKYPTNQEIAAFYALSLLGSVPEGRDTTIFGRGAVIAQGILAENPNHPGALHYLIHSYDDLDHAPQALKAAFSYAEVAPDASHALHMPSHIYVALGMWDHVVASNERSYQASLNRMERKNLGHNARGYHAFHWLEYGYLQQGRNEEAQKMVNDMQTYSTEAPSKRARVHMVFLKATYLVETNDWNNAIADISIDVSDLNVSVRSQYHFIDGMKAFKAKDISTLERTINQIETDYEKEAILANNDQVTMCSGVTREKPSMMNINESKVMAFQLHGLKAWLENNKTLTEEWLNKAVQLEQSLSYNYGPPHIKKPSTELLAEWLMEQKRYEEALQQYDYTLLRAPKRLATLKGKKAAATALRDTKTIEAINSQIQENLNYKKS